MALRHLSTEDLITELFNFGIEVTEKERSKFKDDEDICLEKARDCQWDDCQRSH